MRGIHKSFPGVQALDDVALAAEPGEVVALVGENGAGKSTLIKVLSGCYRADTGEVDFDGRRLGHYGPHEAQRLGISVIYQEFNLAPPLSVAENVFVGRQPRTRLGTVAFGRMRSDTQRILDSLDLPLDARRPVASLSVAEQQMVEIAKAISFQAKLIVMDEPTAALAEHETAKLFDLVRRLKEQGVAVIYISHRLEEVFALADRVVVLRDGRNAGELAIGEATVDREDNRPQWLREDESRGQSSAAASRGQIVRLMVGRELGEMFHKEAVPLREPVLEVRGLSRAASRVRDVSLAVRAGEIVSLAGLVGAGRTEIARAVFGVDRPDAGEVRVGGKPVAIRCPRDAIRAGMGLVTENRKEQGLFLMLAVRENMTSAGLDRLSLLDFVRPRAERELVGSMIEQLRIRTPSQEQRVEFLSGGNQQKVVLARWLALKPRVLILDEPTRGIDVGAKAEVYALMGQLVRQGVGILMISSELPEVLGMSDRVLVVREGGIAGELSRAEATQEAIIHLATGGR